MRSLEFYRTAGGGCPVEEFLDSLSDSDARKVAWVLRLVERFDMVPGQYLKKLVGTEGIWEIRVRTGRMNCRFLGFYETPTLLVLTGGFSKKQDRIQRREIDLAIRRRTEHMWRKKQ